MSLEGERVRKRATSKPNMDIEQFIFIDLSIRHVDETISKEMSLCKKQNHQKLNYLIACEKQHNNEASGIKKFDNCNVNSHRWWL